MMLDYDEESVIATFDQTANEKKEHKGLQVIPLKCLSVVGENVLITRPVCLSNQRLIML